MDDETAYKLLKLVQEEPNISQREIAQELGISLGKANYCLKAVMERGWVKAKNFINSENKRGYLYLLTNKGINEKAKVTFRFLKYKIDEYEALEAEIAQIRKEADRLKQEERELSDEAR
ncbi:MAG: MarR family EPS-associated transcriptional regulator [Gammaproteobacteria bacterium]|nr:MarR family EPS-associated transcriptional regulator [Gammaproteobacteria bacterium]